MTLVLSPSDVEELYRHMSAKHGSKIVDKQKAPEMALVGEFLDGLGILDKKAFLEKFATTIQWVPEGAVKIYLPFEPGDQSRNLLSQVRLCAHEHQHVIQFFRDPVLAINYLADPERRGSYESECYRCNMEVHYWATGLILDPARLASYLKHYALEQENIDFVQKQLELVVPTLEAGGIHNQASKDVIRFLQGRGHEGTVKL